MPRAIRLLAIFSVLAVLCAEGVAHAQLAEGFSLKTVPLGFGGAYRAIADTNAALLINPAGIAQRKGIVSAGGDYLHNGFSDSNAFSVSVVDFKASEAVALGLEYDRDTPTYGTTHVTINHLTLSAAKDFAGIVFAGVSAKGYITQVDSPLVNGRDSVDVDVGVLVKPFEMLALGLTMENLIQGGKYQEYPRAFGMGLGVFLPPHARLGIDLLRNLNTSGAAALNAYFGGEVRLGEGLFLRGGYGLDRIAQNNFYSLGLQVAGPRIGLNFTFSQRLAPTTETYAVNAEVYF